MNHIIGIDLGTTNSEISYLKDDVPTIIPVEGENLMPSCVGLDPGSAVIVGRTARNQMISHPENTILSIKRQMGTNTTVKLGDKGLSPEEVSSLILIKLKQAAEEFLGSKVEKAVITVPAYFDDSQRRATKNAGILAGLEVVRIINEPTAAALAYEADKLQNNKILVYDLGGGTFDVSLVESENGIVEVKSSHGDTRLGGDDFDRLLIDYVAAIFKDRHGFDLTSDPSSFNRLWAAVEKAKRILSDRPFTVIREEYIYEDCHLDVEISRDAYEEMIRPLIRKTLDSVHACLNDALCLPKAIDQILLVGGATRTPLVSDMLLADMKIEPHNRINPDLIVAMGAAMQGGAVQGQKTRSVLVDITPYTFGTRVVGEHEGVPRDDIVIPIIKKNTALPVAKEEVFYTTVDNQLAVNIEIYQGESRFVEDNIFIGDFLVSGLGKVPHGNQILVSLELDINGILHVTAREKATGLSKTVKMDTHNRASQIDLGKAQKTISEMTDSDADDDEAVFSAAEDRQDIVNQAKSLRKRAERLKDRINDEDAAELKSLLEQSRQALSQQDWDTLADINESLSDMIFYLED